MSARGVDFSSLTRAERTVLIGSGLLFANGFVPWWFRASVAGGAFTGNAGLSNPTFIAVLAGAVAAIAVLARAMIWPEPAPRKDSVVYLALGIAAGGATIVSLATRSGVWLGHYASLTLSAIVILGAVRRARERRSGWT